MQFHERIQDEKYQELLGTMIDAFYANVRGVKLVELIKSEANCDMVETLIRYANDNFDIRDSMLLMLVLGVYLASRDAAILPLDLN